jgi:hypothetical protein
MQNGDSDEPSFEIAQDDIVIGEIRIVGGGLLERDVKNVGFTVVATPNYRGKTRAILNEALKLAYVYGHNTILRGGGPALREKAVMRNPSAELTSL